MDVEGPANVPAGAEVAASRCLDPVHEHVGCLVLVLAFVVRRPLQGGGRGEVSQSVYSVGVLHLDVRVVLLEVGALGPLRLRDGFLLRGLDVERGLKAGRLHVLDLVVLDVYVVSVEFRHVESLKGARVLLSDSVQLQFFGDRVGDGREGGLPGGRSQRGDFRRAGPGWRDGFGGDWSWWQGTLCGAGPR